MARITDVFEQIQALCQENKIAKNLFESADNRSMPLERRIPFLQGVIEDDQCDSALKTKLANDTLTHIQALFGALTEQTNRENSAQVKPVLAAKEALDLLFRTGAWS